MSKERETLALPVNTTVGRYTLRHVDSSWGFYLTYLAEVTGTAQRVLIHELVPEELVTRTSDGLLQGKTDRDQQNLAWARERFLAEGRSLQSCIHPALQKILDVFEANGTAYWVTPLDEKRSLKGWLDELRRPPTEEELRALLNPVLAALEKLHAAGLHHFNLKLDSIQLTPGGQPVLVRFAASRQAIARHSHEATAATTGYSPIEQYDPDKTEGAWTDIYSLAAVLHRAIGGKAPPEATQRVGSDPYERLSKRFSRQYDPGFLTAIDAALAVDPHARPQDIPGWRYMFGVTGENGASQFLRRYPRALAAIAALIVALVAFALWHALRPKPVPPLDDRFKVAEQQKKKQEEEQKRIEEEKKKAEEEARAAEEQRKQQEQQLAEAKKKAGEERAAAEKAAAAAAAAEKQAEADDAQKAEAAKAAAEKAEAEKAAAAQAQKAAEDAKSAKKKAAEKESADAAEKSRASQAAADKAAGEAGAAEVGAKKATAEKATAEKDVADKKVVEKTIAHQLATIGVARKTAEAKTARDPAAAAKAAAEKTAAEKEAQKAEAGKAAAQQEAAAKAEAKKTAAEKLAAAIAAQKTLEAKANPDKAAAEKAATGKAAAEKAATEKAAAEKAVAEKAAAEKAAKEKAAAEKAAAEKAAAEKEAAEMAAKKAAEEKEKQQNQGGPPPPPSGGAAGQVGSGLGGIWETTEKDGSGHPLKRLTIYADTHYELVSGGATDIGVIRAKLGIISMESGTAQAVYASTFKYKSMSIIDTDGALGKFEWVRTRADAPEWGRK